MSPILLLFALTNQTPATQPVEVTFRTLTFGKSNQIKEGGAIVLRTAKAFDDYRKKMGTSDQKRPVIDWSKEQVVALHAAGADFGPSSIQVLKVRKKANGSLEIEAAVNRPLRMTPPSFSLTPVSQNGLYTLIAVPSAQGEVTLKVVDPPTSSGDKSGTPG